MIHHHHHCFSLVLKQTFICQRIAAWVHEVRSLVEICIRFSLPNPNEIQSVLYQNVVWKGIDFEKWSQRFRNYSRKSNRSMSKECQSNKKYSASSMPLSIGHIRFTVSLKLSLNFWKSNLLRLTFLGILRIPPFVNHKRKDVNCDWLTDQWDERSVLGHAQIYKERMKCDNH